MLTTTHNLVLLGLIGPHKAIHTVADRSLGKMVKGKAFWIQRPSKTAGKDIYFHWIELPSLIYHMSTSPPYQKLSDVLLHQTQNLPQSDAGLHFKSNFGNPYNFSQACSSYKNIS